MKRKTRNLKNETKEKISASLRGKSKTFEHRKAISISLKRYWQTIPSDKD